MVSRNLYTIARAGAQRFLDSYQEERRRWPNRRGLTYDDLINHVVLAATQAIEEYPTPIISPRARAAFERLVADMPDHDGDIALVRREMLGNAPLPSDRLPIALRDRLKKDALVTDVLLLLKKHNWGPLNRTPGPKRTTPSKLSYCPKHGPDSEFRRYHKGRNKSQYQWRCWLCLKESQARARAKVTSHITLDNPP